MEKTREELGWSLQEKVLIKYERVDPSLEIESFPIICTVSFQVGQKPIFVRKNAAFTDYGLSYANGMEGDLDPEEVKRREAERKRKFNEHWSEIVNSPKTPREKN